MDTFSWAIMNLTLGLAKLGVSLWEVIEKFKSTELEKQKLKAEERERERHRAEADEVRAEEEARQAREERIQADQRAMAAAEAQVMIPGASMMGQGCRSPCRPLTLLVVRSSHNNSV